MDLAKVDSQEILAKVMMNAPQITSVALSRVRDSLGNSVALQKLSMKSALRTGNARIHTFVQDLTLLNPLSVCRDGQFKKGNILLTLSFA